MTAIRISVITETYLPDINGVANSLAQLLSALDPNKFRIQIIRTRPRTEWKPVFEEVWTAGMSIPMYPDLQLGWPAKKSIQEAWGSFQPDIVYIATEGPLSVSALKLAHKQQIPVLSAFHTNFHRYSSYYGLGWIKSLTLGWLRHFHNRTLKTIVPAQEVKDALNADGFERVEVLPHGVDCELFNPRRRSSGLRNEWQAEGKPVWLYVGRIAAEKNIPLALASYKEAKAAYPDLTMVVVGDGPLRKQLEKDYPEVFFVGTKTGEELARYYASADYFIFPSLTETYGLVTTEALASGLPVLAYNMAAAAMHVAPDRAGCLAHVDDAKHFIQQARVMMTLDQNSLSIEARNIAESISWGSVAQRFSEHLVIALRSSEPQNLRVSPENS